MIGGTTPELQLLAACCHENMRCHSLTLGARDSVCHIFRVAIDFSLVPLRLIQDEVLEIPPMV